MRKRILNIILINLMIFFALISIHEISHVAACLVSGCEYGKAILLDNTFAGPHTEFFCSSKISENLVYSIGLIVTSLFSLGFLFLDSSEKNIFFISLGVSVIFSSSDISMIFNTQSLIYPLILSGFSVMTLGEYFMASSHIKEDFFLDFLRNRGYKSERDI